jgi:two-component system response regulator RegX3
MSPTVGDPLKRDVQRKSNFLPNRRGRSILGRVERSTGQTAGVNILVVEDDPSIAESLRSGLESHNMRVHVVDTGAAALDAVGYDIMLLDIGLPDIDGFEVCRRIRAVSEVPIIMLTARADEIDKVLGLESGADDYVPKPFGLRELVARIRAVNRRAQSEATPVARFVVGPLALDPSTRRCHVGDEEVVLTAKEFDLLAHLMEVPGAVHRRLEILEAVWETDWYGPTKTLDAHIASLRKKLGHPEWIESVRGVGFRLDVE